MKKFGIVGLAVIFAAFLMIFNSCKKDFEEINTDPNKAGLDKAAPDMLLTNIIESLSDRVHEIFLGEEMGNCWAQHEAKVQYTDEDRYIYRVSVVNNSWSSFYAASGMDAHTLYNYAVEKKLPRYQGIALILKGYIATLVTDLWGPVPYSEAWTGENTLPKYDTQESIYRDVIAKLDEANTLLKVTTGEKIEGDIMYNGDVKKWRKFANSLRLRLLLRMSEKDVAFVTTEMTKMIVTADTLYPIFSDNEDNAQLYYLGSAPNNHPMNENRKTRDDHRVSKTLTDMLRTNAVYIDWRITIYAEVSGLGDFNGMQNGLTSSQAASFNGNGIKNTSKVGSYFTQATAPGMLMSYAELQFILAEAALKGYITGMGVTEAEAYYKAGIFGSYNQFGDAFLKRIEEVFFSPTNPMPVGITLDDFAQDFYQNDSWGWDPNPAVAMEKIATQRWVASFDQGLQSWIEWRRTGYPVLVAGAENMNNDKVPQRFPYPTDEYARNPSNLEAGKTLLGGADNLNTRVWWDVTENN